MVERASETRHVVVHDTSEIRAARDLIAAASQQYVGADRADDVRLAVSELITNALEHGDGGDTSVEYGVAEDAFVVTVRASSSDLPVRPAAAAGANQVSGRGLYIVAGVSDEVFITGAGDAVSVSCSFRF